MNEQLTQEQAIKLLKDYQDRRGFKLKEFAELLKVSPQYLAGIYAKNQFPNETVGFKKTKTVTFVQIEDFDDLIHR